jgi:5-oxoprolinase (ATP-hydrolysing)
MQTVLIHPLAGLLSAYGMGLADVRALRQRAVEVVLDAAALTAVADAFDELERAARAELNRQGVPDERVQCAHRLLLKYSGTDSTLEVPRGSYDDVRASFESLYRARYGFLMPERSCLIEAVTVEAIGDSVRVSESMSPTPARSGGAPSPIGRHRVYFGHEWLDTPVYDRAKLFCGELIPGPALICEPNTTIVIEPGWRAELNALGHVILRRVTVLVRSHAAGTDADPVLLEVFNNLFMSIAEQMGVTLANTSYSVNIKERLDFSCAVFDGEGQLIANAPHMPVHLGSMGESVQTILRETSSS